MKRYLVFLILLCSFQFLNAQSNSIVINCDGKLFGDVLYDIILDKDKYDNKILELDNVLFSEFGFESQTITFAWCSDWFKDTETYEVKKNDIMYDNKFKIFYHPLSTDQEGRKFALKLKGKYFTVPKKVTLNGKFVIHKINHGPTILLYLLDSFTINDTKYNGSLPTTISTQ